MTTLRVTGTHYIRGLGLVVCGTVTSGTVEPLMRVKFLNQNKECVCNGRLPATCCNKDEMPFYAAGYTAGTRVALHVVFDDQSRRPSVGDTMICELPTSE